jgi:RimJ/RimL family protein N-acetyltransferase
MLVDDRGFVEEGRSRESVWMNNGWHDDVRMGLLRSEWEASREGSKQK